MEVLATRRRLYGEDYGLTIEATEGVALVETLQGGPEKLQSALETLSRVYAWRIRLFGRDHEDTMTTAGHLADSLRIAGNLVKAESLYREVLERRSRVLGPDHVDSFYGEFTLIGCLIRSGQIAEAHERQVQLLPCARRVLGPRHDLTEKLAGMFS